MDQTERFDARTWFATIALKGFTVRAALLRGSERVLIWDTLTHPRDMLPFRSLLAGRRPVIVYSHGDWDHLWGTAGLPWEEALIVAHAASLERFRDEIPQELKDRQDAEPGRWEDVKLLAPTRTFAEELCLELGGLTVELRHLPGHTADSITALVPETGLLLLGDAAELPLPVVPQKAPLAEWIAGLRRLDADPRVRTVVPAHGSVGGREILKQNIDYLEELRAGCPPSLPEPCSDFYRQTHRDNLRWRPAG